MTQTLYNSQQGRNVLRSHAQQKHRQTKYTEYPLWLPLCSMDALDVLLHGCMISGTRSLFLSVWQEVK